MTTKSNSKCKKCRRLGMPVCGSVKCAFLRRQALPGKSKSGQRSRGARGSRPSRRSLSEYGKQLFEKQKLRAIYDVNERQFRNYIEELIKEQGERRKDTVSELLWVLERRLDNVVYRMGFASSRRMARQLVSHGHFFVNGARVTIPSYALRVSDTIRVRSKSEKTGPFKSAAENLKEYQSPLWLEVDKDKMEGRIVSLPTREDTGDDTNIQMVFEYYAR